MTVTYSDRLLNDFATRCFRDMADRDYVNARLAFRARLIPQFLWSSLHCLEKYAKCILLLNRIPAKNIKHEALRALELVGSKGKFSIEPSSETKEFITRLEHGARFRYFEVSYYSLGYDVIHLDRAVWEIRRYAQSIDYSIGPEGAEIGMLTRELSRLRNELELKSKDTCIQYGWLEDVINNSSHPAREPLIWQNLYFGTSRRKKIRISGYSESGNAPLYLHPEILELIQDYIFLPKELISAFGEHLKNLKEGSAR